MSEENTKPKTETETKTKTMTIETAQSELVGMTTAEAKALLTELGFKMRVGSEDGEQRMMTADYRKDRLTVDVEEDIIVAVQRG